MEDIKQLIEMVKSLPNAALWVLGGYLFFKLSIIASIYGTIRYLADLALQAYKHERVVIYKADFGKGIFISKEVEQEFQEQVRRLIRSSSLYYTHGSDIANLVKAVNAVLDKQEAEKAGR